MRIGKEPIALLISHFNASSKAFVHQRKIPATISPDVAADRRRNSDSLDGIAQ